MSDQEKRPSERERALARDLVCYYDAGIGTPSECARQIAKGIALYRAEIEREKDAEIDSLKVQLAEAREEVDALLGDIGGLEEVGRIKDARIAELEAEIEREKGVSMRVMADFLALRHRHAEEMQEARRLSSAFIAAWHDGETNRGCYSQSDAHDSRCASEQISKWTKTKPCNCGRFELDKAADELHAWLAGHPAREPEEREEPHE